MFSLKQKRNKTTYLKIQDGKVLDKQDTFKEQEERKIDSPPKKQKRSVQLLFLIGGTCILLPLFLLGYPVNYQNFNQLKNYMSNHTENIPNNPNNPNEPSITTSYTTNSIKQIFHTLDLVNTSINTIYQLVRDDITTNYEHNLNTKFDTYIKTAKKNKGFLSKEKERFFQNDQENLYYLALERYDLLISSIHSFKTVSNHTLVDKFNKSVKKNNELLSEEISLLKKALERYNLPYQETNKKIKLLF